MRSSPGSLGGASCRRSSPMTRVDAQPDWENYLGDSQHRKQVQFQGDRSPRGDDVIRASSSANPPWMATVCGSCASPTSLKGRGQRWRPNIGNLDSQGDLRRARRKSPPYALPPARPNPPAPPAALRPCGSGRSRHASSSSSSWKVLGQDTPSVVPSWTKHPRHREAPLPSRSCASSDPEG
jgi:hypothetical protein